MSKNLWVTYAWVDNEDKDIDYIVNRLDAAGINTLYDRRALVPGQRLWEQIGKKIADTSRVDAFSFIVTPNSIASEPCKEELSYAIQRVMDERGGGFPVIGLMHRVRAADLPPLLKARLCIPLESPNWVDGVVAGINKQAPPYQPLNVAPYVIKTHKVTVGYWIQITPRFEPVSPVSVAVDLEEHQSGNILNVFCAPSGQIPGANGFLSVVKHGSLEGTSKLSDGAETAVYFWNMTEEATFNRSYWIQCKSPPPRIWFGNGERGLAVLFPIG
jgi:hypothetical protein